MVRQQLEDLEHDHTVLSQILSLVSSLKNTYKVSYLLPKRGVRPIRLVGDMSTDAWICVTKGYWPDYSILLLKCDESETLSCGYQNT